MTTIQATSPTLTVSPKQMTIASRILQRIRANGDAGTGPFAQRRPEGTLKATMGWDPGNRKEGIAPALNSGAMLFYRNLVRLPRATGKTVQKRTGAQIYGALALALAFPTLRQDPTPGKHARKVFRKVWASVSEAWTVRAVHNLVSVKKNDDSFSVRLPVFFASKEILSGLQSFYSDPQQRTTDWTISGDPEDAVAQQSADVPFALREGKYTVADIPNSGGPFDRYIPWLKSAKNGHIQVERLGGNLDSAPYVFFLCLDFTQAEATVLCQTSWLEIRPIDFYALMYTWAAGRAGSTRSDPPIYSLPMSRIARELPSGGIPRVSKDLSILVDEKSDYWWIEDTNKIATFEGSYSKHLMRKDGTLCAMSSDPDDRPAPAPASGLIFVDWINLKMAFVNSEGRMEVSGLDRAVPANATHYLRVLKFSVHGEMGASIVSRTVSLAQDLGHSSPSYRDITGLLKEILLLPEFQGNAVEDITIQDIYDCRDRLQVCAEFLAAARVVLSYADTSIDNLYARYSYRTVSHLIAYLKIIAKYAPEYHSVSAEDRERRKAYVGQDNLPTDFEPESVPYLSELKEDGTGERALMPHQARNTRRLASSPNFAILAVDAGGGKTITCAYDFLKELGKGNVRRGLIMCPSHLVAAYVKEFLYFTDSRVNVIAITTYTIKRHGLDGLAKLLLNAPPNTVVVTDYNLALGKSKSPSMGYGPVPTRYYPVVEMLRSFMFDYVFCDESHYLKGSTGRNAAVSRLISDIPYKRLASGTLTPNQITDLVNQINLLDPTILPRKELLDKYAVVVKGDKVTKWKDGYEKELLADIKEHVVWCQTKRKEWAALLPRMLETFEFCRMTSNQQSVYRTILNEVVEELRRAAEGNQALRDLLSGKAEGSDEAEADEENDADADADETAGDPVDVDALLRPYLARLEQFVVAPAADVYGNTVLHGEDRVSPKVAKIEEIIRQHLDSGIQGKILIFTNLTASAEAIYQNLSPDLRAKTIHYLAANKEADAAKFERDPNKMVMVGVETSMNTGLNLQFCSRLIRVDSVWTPGALEQGNSRIQRPNVKQAETRTKVHLNWVMCEFSIDVAKQAYLLQKQVTIGKWEESGHPEFQAIDNPPAFSISLDVIRECDQSDRAGLVDYFDAYSALKMATFRSWDQYAKDHPEDVDPQTGLMKMTKLARAPNQPGAALMYRVPYVPGTELYKAEDLGLIRYDAYLEIDEAELSDDEEEEDNKEDATQAAKSRAEFEKVRGLAVHTEYGDGNIASVGRKFVIVQLSSGGRVRVHKLSAFIITRAQTNNKDQRELLLRQIGDLPYDKPFDLQVPDPKDVKIPKNDESTPDDRISVSLYIRVSNDIVGLEMNNAKENPRGAAALEAFGFQQPVPYLYAEMPTAMHMLKQFKAWHAAGFQIHKESNEACKTLYTNLINARKNAASMIGQAQAADLRNFHKLQRKPDPDRKMLYPYPLIEDDTLYLALPLTGHPATQQARRVKVAGVTWDEVDVEDYRVVYMKTLNTLDANVPRLLKQGLIISNIKDLIKRRRKLQVRHGDILSK